MTHTDARLADDRLARAFAADLPPARDHDFSLALMARMARRQCLADLAGSGVIAAVGALMLWALWPVLAKALNPVVLETWQAVAPAAAALTVALTVVAFVVSAPNPGHRAQA